MLKNYSKFCLLIISVAIVKLSSPLPLVAAYENVLLDFNLLGNEANLKNEQEKMLHNDKWKIELNESANYILNRKLSYTKNVLLGQPPQDDKLIINKGAQNYVMGVRVNFPKSRYSSYAVLIPFIEINAYTTEETQEGTGFIKNVGGIKAIKAYVKGRNFPQMMSISLTDNENLTSSYQLGHLKYNGWKELIWNNPNYISDIRFRKLIRPPLYQSVEPLIKISSLAFYRQGNEATGDFVTYISWIKLEYDKAQIKAEEDIDDEAVWEIQKTMFLEKKAIEDKRLNNTTELQNLELQKMNLTPQQNGAGATPPGGAGGN